MKRLKVLHIVSTLEAGGIEKLVSDLSRHYTKKNIYLKVLCVKRKCGIHVPIISQNGVEIVFLCDFKKHPIKFLKLYNLYLSYENFDIIHSHLNFISWFFINKFIGTRKEYRIAHFHNTFLKPRNIGLALSRSINLFLTNTSSDINIGISKACLASIFGDSWDKSNKNELIYNGVDFEDYRCNEYPKSKVNEFIIGHVGRLRHQKNHMFMISIAETLVKKNHNIHFVFIGSGELYDTLANKVQELNLQNNVHFLGERNDVNKLICQFDLFLLPSLFEGFGLSLIEAQIARIPCIVSENISPEIPLIPPSMSVDLSNPTDWIDACLFFSNNKNKITKPANSDCLNKFELKNWVVSLEKIYRKSK